MASIHQGRWTAEIEGDFVVFIIGARPTLRHPIKAIKDYDLRRVISFHSRVNRALNIANIVAIAAFRVPARSLITRGNVFAG